jgi:ribonuclease HII
MLFKREEALYAHYTAVAGTDEAGRGALAGPLLVAAVLLGRGVRIDGLNDSKKLTEAQREALYDEITARAAAWAVVQMSVAEVEELNPLGASMEGMRRAVLLLDQHPDLVLADGNRLPGGLDCPARAEVKGDGRFACIAAASIIAKVTRDRLMVALDEQYPAYGFARHKGYGTAEHLEAIARHGICPLHRKTYGPCAQTTLSF